MNRVSDLWQRFWALSWRAKGAIIAASILALSVAVIVGVALVGSSDDQKVEVGKPARTPTAAVRQVTPTPTAALPDTAEPSPTATQPEPTTTSAQPSPTAVASPSPPPEPSGDGAGDSASDGAAPSSDGGASGTTPSLQSDEAKALAIDWLVQQGGELDGNYLFLADGPPPLSPSLLLFISACLADPAPGRWTISCEGVRFVAGPGQIVAHISVDEATRAVTWHEPPLTTN